MSAAPIIRAEQLELADLIAERLAARAVGELIDAAELADLIAERLAARAAGELIDAAELARRLRVTRDFVYEHSAAFGAIRLGTGTRPRLHFRWPQALDRLGELEERPKARTPTKATTRRPRRERSTGPVDLLPIRGRSA